VNASRTEQGAEPDPLVLVPVNGGAVTYISAEDLAAVEAAGGTTLGVPVAVNGQHLHADCPECNSPDAGG
jgi:hypothetical protein